MPYYICSWIPEGNGVGGAGTIFYEIIADSFPNLMASPSPEALSSSGSSTTRNVKKKKNYAKTYAVIKRVF